MHRRRNIQVNKFFHAILSGWGLSASVVVGIGCWYLLQKRHIDFALRSVKTGAVFGLVSFVLLAATGDGSAYEVAQKQPMKLAAMEGLYQGENGAGLIAVGVINPAKKSYRDDIDPMLFKIEIPKLLSLMGYRNIDAFVPGIKDIIGGGYTMTDGTAALSFEEKKARGEKAIAALAAYQIAKKEGRDADAANHEIVLRENYPYFGYGYLTDARLTMVFRWRLK